MRYEAELRESMNSLMLDDSKAANEYVRYLLDESYEGCTFRKRAKEEQVVHDIVREEDDTIMFYVECEINDYVQQNGYTEDYLNSDDYDDEWDELVSELYPEFQRIAEDELLDYVLLDYVCEKMKEEGYDYVELKNCFVTEEEHQDRAKEFEKYIELFVTIDDARRIGACFTEQEIIELAEEYGLYIDKRERYGYIKITDYYLIDIHFRRHHREDIYTINVINRGI